jgi:hypothetical protein
MKPLPDRFAIHGAGDRLFAISPDERAMHGRTFERRELHVDDGHRSTSSPAALKRRAPEKIVQRCVPRWPA